MIIVTVLLHIVIFTGNIGLAHQDADSDPIKLTPNNQQRVMVGENVIITCMTTMSSIMAWSSKEYIGEGGRQLEFLITDAIGTTHNESMAFANLTSVNQSTSILESQLHITVSPNYPQFNVTCHNTGNNSMESVNFLVVNKTSTDHITTETETSSTTRNMASNHYLKISQLMTTMVVLILLLF